MRCQRNSLLDEAAGVAECWLSITVDMLNLTAVFRFSYASYVALLQRTESLATCREYWGQQIGQPDWTATRQHLRSMLRHRDNSFDRTRDHALVSTGLLTGVTLFLLPEGIRLANSVAVYPRSHYVCTKTSSTCTPSTIKRSWVKLIPVWLLFECLQVVFSGIIRGCKEH